ADAVRPQFGLPALADAAQGPLAAGVGRRGGGALHAGGRGDVHDVALTTLLHERDDAIGYVDQAEHIRVEHLLHLFDVERADFGTIGVGRVVDQNVDTAHAFDAQFDSPGVVVAHRDVSVNPERAG